MLRPVQFQVPTTDKNSIAVIGDKNLKSSLIESVDDNHFNMILTSLDVTIVLSGPCPAVPAGLTHDEFGGDALLSGSLPHGLDLGGEDERLLLHHRLQRRLQRRERCDQTHTHTHTHIHIHVTNGTQRGSYTK